MFKKLSQIECGDSFLIIRKFKKMKVIEISRHVVYYLETDEEDLNFFTRYSADNWSVRMGESDEPVYNNETVAELETAFQRWVNRNETKEK